MIKYQCYHGTGESNSKQIQSSKEFKFKYRSNHWLGQGVYFFINDYDKAEWWAKHNRPNKETSPVVLKCEVELKNSELLDLNTERDLIKLDDFAIDFFESLKREKITIKFKDIHEKNCKVIDMFLEKNKGYKAVHRTFDSTKKSLKENGAGFNLLSDQLCIVDQSVIPFENIELIRLVHEGGKIC